MYTSDVACVSYSDPWALSFETRLEMLCRGSPRAAYLYELPDTSTFRYRVFNVAQTLASSGPGGSSASWFTRNDLDRMDRVLDLCDVLVICRVRYTSRIARVVEMARSRGRRVLFDCDDLVFDSRFVPLIVDTLGLDKSDPQIWDAWFAVISRIGATFQLCDGVITTNTYLAEQAKTSFGDARPAKIIPNYLERRQEELSREIFSAKEASGWERDGMVTVGYFSGTPTHNLDFAICAGALAMIMDEDATVQLRLVGFLDPGPELARHSRRIEVHPLQDYLNLQRLIGGAEINIVPLQDNVFTNCKSALKWFESAIVGTVTLATPTFTYRQSVTHGRTGWLVRQQEWCSALSDVIAELDDIGAVRAAGRDAALEAHGSDRQRATIDAALFEL